MSSFKWLIVTVQAVTLQHPYNTFEDGALAPSPPPVRQNVRPAHRTADLTLVQPLVDANLVERVPAVAELPDLVPQLQPLQAEGADGGIVDGVCAAAPGKAGQGSEFDHRELGLDRRRRGPGRSGLGGRRSRVGGLIHRSKVDHSCQDEGAYPS